MNASLISAFAALAGASIVAAVSFLRSWLVHHGQVRAQWVAQEQLRLQDLYKEFIEESSKCYLDALQRHEPDISLLVVLYAKMSRMRVLASPNVLASAERALKRILDTYSETDVKFSDINLRTMVQQESLAHPVPPPAPGSLAADSAPGSAAHLISGEEPNQRSRWYPKCHWSESDRRN
jgi:hypothetical protein